MEKQEALETYQDAVDFFEALRTENPGYYQEIVRINPKPHQAILLANRVPITQWMEIYDTVDYLRFAKPTLALREYQKLELICKELE